MKKKKKVNEYTNIYSRKLKAHHHIPLVEKLVCIPQICFAAHASTIFINLGLFEGASFLGKHTDFEDHHLPLAVIPALYLYPEKWCQAHRLP